MSKITDFFLNVVIPVALGVTIYLLPIRQEIKNYLPDALWAYAFVSTLLIIWDRKLPIIWLAGILFVFVAFELAQKTGITKGTGDVIDIIIYFISATIAVGVNSLLQTKKHSI